MIYNLNARSGKLDVDTGIAELTKLFNAVAPKVKYEKEIKELQAKQEELFKSYQQASKADRAGIVAQMDEISDKIEDMKQPAQDDTA